MAHRLKPHIEQLSACANLEGGWGSGQGLDSLKNSYIYILVKLLKTEADPAIWQREDPIDENQEL